MEASFFGNAAAAAQRKRAKDVQLYKGKPVTMDNNPLMDLIAERRAEREAADRKAEAWRAKIAQTFAEITVLANSVGRNVKEITFNGEVAFVVRETEAVRIYTGPIRNMRELQQAAAKLTNAAMGC